MADRAADPPVAPLAPPPPPTSPAVDVDVGGPLLVAPASSGTRFGHGSVVVATDALLAHSERVGLLRDALERGAMALARLMPPPADQLAIAPAGAVRSVREIPAAHTLTRAAAHAAAAAADALRVAIDRYAAEEERQRERAIDLDARLGAGVGPLLRELIVLGLPAVLLAHAAGWPSRGQLAGLRQWMLDHPGLITSPAFVETVRASVMSVDETAGSVAGLPPGAATVMAGAAGFTGVQAGAAYVIGAGRPLGLFRESPISIERVRTGGVASPPTGAVERLARVPEGDQVRIERYEAPGSPPRYVVYVGPTETFSPIATDEPWDLTSNVQGVAGSSAGSIRAVDAAMHDAGIASTDQVQLVGFSQGGLVAARIAASADWNVVGLETYGAPSGNIQLPDGLVGMAVRNTDDFIPALAGPQLDHGLLQVERQAFAPGSPIPTDLPAPAHQRSAYVATASAIDAAQSRAVRDQVAAMDAFTSDYTGRDGSSITAMTFHATRGAERAVASISSGGSIP